MGGLTKEDHDQLAESEFIASAEGLGAKDVWVMRRTDDRGQGLGVCYVSDGVLRRHAVFMEDFDSEAAYAALLGWLEEKLHG